MTSLPQNRPSSPASANLPETLDQLMQRKIALLQEIREQKARMTQITHDIAAPFAPTARKSNSIMRAFNRGMIALDGLMLGLRIMRKFRGLFGHRRR